MSVRTISWLTSGVVGLVAAGGGCRSARAPADAAPHNQVVGAPWGAEVTVGDRPVTAGAAFLLDRAGAVVASTAITDGRYRWPQAPTVPAVALVVRLEAPAIAVVKAAITGGVAPPIAIAAGDVVALDVTVVPPAGVDFDWAVVEFTPVTAAVAPTVVLRADERGGLRGAMVSARHDQPRFTIEVLRGDYRIGASRVVDAPAKSAAAAADLTLAGISGGVTATPASLAGAVVTISAPAAIHLTLRPLRPDER